MSLRDLGDDRQIVRILPIPGGPAVAWPCRRTARLWPSGATRPGSLVYDLARGGPGIPLAEPAYAIRTLTFSPDGRTLAASAERDGEILFWDIDASRVRARLRGRHPALSLAFAPDGRAVAAGEKEERRVTLWDLDTGRSRPISGGTFGSVSSVAFRPTGACWPPRPRTSGPSGSGTRSRGGCGSRSPVMSAAARPSFSPGWPLARHVGQ